MIRKLLLEALGSDQKIFQGEEVEISGTFYYVDATAYGQRTDDSDFRRSSYGPGVVTKIDSVEVTRVIRVDGDTEIEVQLTDPIVQEIEYELGERARTDEAFGQ